VTVSISRLTPKTNHYSELLQDVLHGFTAYHKYLPSKYFYDVRGSELFEKITGLPEYYLTQAEIEILERHALHILASVNPDELVELGSGSSRKTLLLLDALHSTGSGSRYVPIEISEDTLSEAADALTDRYNWLEVDGIVGDYVADLPKLRRKGRRLIAFLGSTIGNYVPTLRYALLRSVVEAMEPDDAFVLGVDLIKDEDTMTRAYDDSAGLSAEFNKNILHVVNRDLGGDLPIDSFEHVSSFNPISGCMEQSLVAKKKILANIRALDLAVTFMPGERLHTEVSCKFSRDQVADEFKDSGMVLVDWMTDTAGLYGLAIGRPLKTA
jgi:L-histidine N-alpha-methyltransferase